jgi:hypothetical protein
LAKEVTFKGQFCIFRFAQHLQNHFKCSLRSLFTNDFMYARDARAQIRPLPWFFRLPNCFTSGFYSRLEAVILKICLNILWRPRCWATLWGIKHSMNVAYYRAAQMEPY